MKEPKHLFSNNLFSRDKLSTSEQIVRGYTTRATRPCFRLYGFHLRHSYGVRPDNMFV